MEFFVIPFLGTLLLITILSFVVKWFLTTSNEYIRLNLDALDEEEMQLLQDGVSVRGALTLAGIVGAVCYVVSFVVFSI